jgi:hypothetical protein
MEEQRGFQKFHICRDLGQAVTNNRYSDFDNFIFSVVNLILLAVSFVIYFGTLPLPWTV